MRALAVSALYCSGCWKGCVGCEWCVCVCGGGVATAVTMLAQPRGRDGDRYGMVVSLPHLKLPHPCFPPEPKNLLLVVPQLFVVVACPCPPCPARVARWQVLRGVDLPNMEVVGKQDPYVKVSLLRVGTRPAPSVRASRGAPVDCACSTCVRAEFALLTLRPRDVL